jgi:hypothetical protein
MALCGLYAGCRLNNHRLITTRGIKKGRTGKRARGQVYNKYEKKGELPMAMNVEIKNNKLYIEIDLETPTPSASGKTLVVASTRGNAVTTAKVNDKPVIIGLNAYIKP